PRSGYPHYCTPLRTLSTKFALLVFRKTPRRQDAKTPRTPSYYCLLTAEAQTPYYWVSAPLRLCASAPLRLCASAPLRLCASAPLRCQTPYYSWRLGVLASWRLGVFWYGCR